MKRKMKIKLKRWIRKNWGKRCPDYCRTCPSCKAWKCFDYLFQFAEEPF